MEKPSPNCDQQFNETVAEVSPNPAFNPEIMMDAKTQQEMASDNDQMTNNGIQMEVGPGGDFKMPSTSSSNSTFKSEGTPEEIDTYQSISGSDTCKRAARSEREAELPGIELDLVLKDVGNDLKTGCLQWTNVFQESGDFEKFCPTRVDKLLAEARAIEENLMQQKEQLMHRLKALSRTLQTI